MGFILMDNGGGDIELIPEATYIATCVLLADLGAQPNTHPQSDGGDIEKMYIGFELNACDSKGVPFFIGDSFTAALGQKANLRKFLEAWRGRVFTEEELRGFDIRNVLGKSCSLDVIHKSGKDPAKKFARIGSVQALPAGVPAYQPVTKPWTFSIGDYNAADYNRLPAFAKKVLEDSYEYKALVAAGLASPAQEAPPLEHDAGFSTQELLTEDDIPF